MSEAEDLGAVVAPTTTYDLLLEASRLVAALQEAEDEAAVAQLVDGWLAGAGGKIEACWAVVQRLSGEQNLLAQLEAGLAAKRRRLEGEEKRVRGLAVSLLKASAEVTGAAKVKTPLFSAWISRSESVEVTDLAALPEDLVEFKRAPKTAAIKAAIKAGVPFDGARVVSKENITFK